MINDICSNLRQVEQRIAKIAVACGRDPKEITLLAVSKTKPGTDILAAYDAGQRCFGENYGQEGVGKIAELSDIPELLWHFIGPLQSNKSRLVAENFAWCHTVDRLKLAQRLAEQRPTTLPPLNVLIQINISQQASKSGIAPEELDALAAQIVALPRLNLRGVMAIPAPTYSQAEQLAVGQKMAVIYRQLAARYPQVDTLSLGMSDDLEAAIIAGSTLVRVGSAIFGQRTYSTPSL